MKVFLSYRRNDTGGRAGRLFDVFVARYGRHNVFQDVNSAAPGLDFTERVDAAIADSDVVLVVIGPAWLASSLPDGVRRIDRPDDFVRREVSTALMSGMPVVPVLVDGAELPASDQLPAELAGLLHRQAVSVRDVSWHQDVDDLIRRLEGADLPVTARRPWLLRVGVGVLVLLVAAIVATVLLDDGDGNDGEADEGSVLTNCPTTFEGWTPIELSGNTVVETTYGEVNDVEAQIVEAWTQAVDGTYTVVVKMDVRNQSDEISDSLKDDVYVGEGLVNGLLVDGIAQGEADCMSVRGNPQMAPTERTVASIGFEVDSDPTDVAIVLEAFGEVPLVVADPEGVHSDG